MKRFGAPKRSSSRSLLCFLSISDVFLFCFFSLFFSLLSSPFSLSSYPFSFIFQLPFSLPYSHFSLPSSPFPFPVPLFSFPLPFFPSHFPLCKQKNIHPWGTLNFPLNLLLLDITFPNSCDKDMLDYKYRCDALSIELIYD